MPATKTNVLEVEARMLKRVYRQVTGSTISVIGDEDDAAETSQETQAQTR